MSEAAIPALDLHSLEQKLQNRLHSESLQSLPLQVRCLLKEGILIILIQHAAPEMPYPRRAFRALRQILKEEGVLESYQVLIYLRLERTKKPYAFHTLAIETAQTEESADLASDPEEMQDTVQPEPEMVATAEPDAPIEDTESFGWVTDDEERAASFEPEPLALGDEPEEYEDNTAVPSFNDEAEDVPEAVSDRRLGKATILFGTGLALAFFAFAFYVLSRPCVIDSCQTLTQAKTLSEQSTKVFAEVPTGQQILDAQKQLGESIKKLKSIPFWSPRYTEAQAALKDAQEMATSLDAVVTALFTASKAANLVQKPPFPVEKWQEIIKLWDEAIAGLQKVPATDFYYPFAQSKIVVYQKNLANVTFRLNLEKQSQATLKEAQEEAKVAAVQQGVAQSLASWETAYLSWATAVQKLQNIPEGTTSYPEAQKLLKDYQPKLADTQSKQSKETIATNIYDQSNRIVELARAAEASNDWARAVFHWRSAISYLQQIPEGTYPASQVPALSERYKENLANAEEKLEASNRLAQAQKDLDKTCAGDPQICNYSLDNNKIEIRLTAAYVKQVQDTAVQASVNNNSDRKAQLLDHIATLEKTLEVISRNTKLPVEVYDVTGVLLVDYKPTES